MKEGRNLLDVDAKLKAPDECENTSGIAMDLAGRCEQR